MNLNDAKINALLGMAGKKLGQDPEALKQQLQDGKLDNIVNKLDPKAQQQLQGFLNDPKKLEGLMADDKVKNLIQGFLNNNK